MKHIASCAFAGSSRNSLKLAANSLIQSVNLHVSTQCPCHFHSPRSGVLRPPQFRHAGSITTPPNTDYAFEMASSAIRFGRGCSAEVGYDLQSMQAKRVIVVTDATVRDLPACATVLASLQHCNIQYSVFDRVQIEPSDASFQDAIQFARAQLTRGGVDAFVAVGGGSVIDTAKAANLYTCFPDNHFLDFVNAPVGKGLPVPGPLKPLIAIPTTAGTGSGLFLVSISHRFF
jgi:hydroxyacid-oxoacid transhydrogenase